MKTDIYLFTGDCKFLTWAWDYKRKVIFEMMIIRIRNQFYDGQFSEVGS